MTQALQVYRRSELEDANCLHRYHQVWELGVDDSSDFSLRGQAFHRISHNYILRLIDRRVAQDFDEAQQAFVEGIAHHQTPNRLIPELRELWMRHAESFALDLDRFVTSEERQEGDGLSFTPDLVYAHPDSLEIVDLKTFWTMLTEREAKDSFQARYYVWQAMQRWPNFPSYRFTFFFVRFNKSTSVVFTPQELDSIRLEVSAAIASIEHARATNHWPAIAGTTCRYCELRCPLVDQEVTLPARFVTPSQAHAAGQWILTADKAVRSIKKTLKAYCAVNGPVNVGGVEFNNRPMTMRSYPIEAVLAALRALGVPEHEGWLSEQGVSLSHSALKPLFKQIPDLEKTLAPSVDQSTRFRFGPKKPGDDEGDEE